MWNPEQYSKYSNERSRPFFDLVGQIRHENPRYIADLGCGSGELTATLAERWTQARIWGVDNSPEMLAKAAPHVIPDRLTFELGDLATWQPPRQLDVLVSNAALHWVLDHNKLIPQLANFIAPQGYLAFQIPGFFDARPVLEEVRSRPQWAEKTGTQSEIFYPENAGWYINILAPLGFTVNAWDTTYFQILQGENAVLEWTKGTTLRPILAKLSAEEQNAFLEEYNTELHKVFPVKPYGTVMPFKRLFVVATRQQ